MAARNSLTRAKSEAICALVEGGNSFVDSARMAGISETSFYAWRKRGERALESREQGERLSAKERVFAEFAEGIKEADAKCIALHLSNIRAAGANGSWQASAWFLERHRPKEYARPAVYDAFADEREAQTVAIVNAVGSLITATTVGLPESTGVHEHEGDSE